MMGVISIVHYYNEITSYYQVNKRSILNRALLRSCLPSVLIWTNNWIIDAHQTLYIVLYGDSKSYVPYQLSHFTKRLFNTKLKHLKASTHQKCLESYHFQRITIFYLHCYKESSFNLFNPTLHASSTICYCYWNI